MSVYVDSSAFLKIYLDEPDRRDCLQLLQQEADWVSARLTEVEVRRNLAVALDGADLRAAKKDFSRDWQTVKKVSLTKAVCQTAAAIAERTAVRSLDAMHLGAAEKAGGGFLPFLTYDVRKSQAAKALGWTVLGV